MSSEVSDSVRREVEQIVMNRCTIMASEVSTQLGRHLIISRTTPAETVTQYDESLSFVDLGMGSSDIKELMSDAEQLRRVKFPGDAEGKFKTSKSACA
jgi:hypothetical protein